MNLHMLILRKKYLKLNELTHLFGKENYMNTISLDHLTDHKCDECNKKAGQIIKLTNKNIYICSSCWSKLKELWGYF